VCAGREALGLDRVNVFLQQVFDVNVAVYYKLVEGGFVNFTILPGMDSHSGWSSFGQYKLSVTFYCYYFCSYLIFCVWE
jgi:hypothetical protein